MLLLIWATLLFSVIGSSTSKVSNQQPSLRNGWTADIKGQISAEAGLCAVIPCSFFIGFYNTPQHVVWYKCEQSKRRCGDSEIILHTNNNNKVQSGFRGRVSLLEPDVNQRNCSIFINDLTESDSGSYRLEVRGHRSNGTNYYMFKNISKINVGGLTQKPTVEVPPLTEGQQTTLTCTAPGLCSGSVPTITWTWRGAGESDSHITRSITEFKTENLTAVTQRHSSALTFDPSAEHHGTKITCKVKYTNNITTEETVTLNVTYVKKPVITGNATVKKGDDLNLTCSLQSFPPSVITWNKQGSNKTLQNENVNTTEGKTGTASLVILNVTEEHSGRYICTAKHQDAVLTAQAEVTVKFPPRFLKGSGCVAEMEVVTCVCISEGIPLPSIKWPQSMTSSEHSVTTSVSKHTVNSSVTVNAHENTTFSCISSNEVRLVHLNLSVTIKEPEQDDLLKMILVMIKVPQVIIAFFIGFLLSATICCLTRTCHRNKKKSSGKMPETPGECLEMVTTQTLPLISAGQAVENNIPNDRDAAEGGAEPAGQSAPDADVEPREVEYSNIDFSLLKRKDPTGAEDMPETTETEYAEIKNKETEERQDRGGEDGEALEDNVENMEDDKEITQCTSAEEDEDGVQDVAVYSTVDEIMDE